jgi:hypothetical protein
MKMRRVLMVLALALFLPGIARADTIHLKNGDVIEGKILSQSEKEVVIQVGKTGSMTIAMRRVERIVKDDKTGESHGGGSITGRKTPPKEKEEPEKPKVEPKDGPTVPKEPAKDCPYIDRSKVDPEAVAIAENYIGRLSSKPKFRNRARNHIRALGEKAGRSLVRALDSPSPLIRKEVTRLLGEIKYKPAVPALIGKGLTDEDVYVRIEAVASLRGMTGKSFRYMPEGLPRIREEGLKKWKRWWEGEQKRYGMTGSLPR